MQIDIRHDRDATRFHAPIHDDEPDRADAGAVEMANMGMVLSYRQVAEGVIDLRSTLVPPHLRGRGLGGQLVRHALDWAREHDTKVIPSCPFVARFIEDHPEYQDLVFQGD
jgi:predicted GNAT family acetyltransferase